MPKRKLIVYVTIQAIPLETSVFSRMQIDTMNAKCANEKQNCYLLFANLFNHQEAYRSAFRTCKIWLLMANTSQCSAINNCRLALITYVKEKS